MLSYWWSWRWLTGWSNLCASVTRLHSLSVLLLINDLDISRAIVALQQLCRLTTVFCNSSSASAHTHQLISLQTQPSCPRSRHELTCNHTITWAHTHSTELTAMGDQQQTTQKTPRAAGGQGGRLLQLPSVARDVLISGIGVSCGTTVTNPIGE